MTSTATGPPERASDLVPGDGSAVVGQHVTALVAAPAEHLVVRGLWDLSRSGGSFDDALSLLGSVGFAQLPELMLVGWEHQTCRLVLRGNVVVEAVDEESGVVLSRLVGADVHSWAEFTVPGARTVRMGLGPTIDTDAFSGHLVVRGVVPAEALRVPAPIDREGPTQSMSEPVVSSEPDSDGTVAPPSRSDVTLADPPEPTIEEPAPPVPSSEPTVASPAGWNPGQARSEPGEDALAPESDGAPMSLDGAVTWPEAELVALQSTPVAHPVEPRGLSVAPPMPDPAPVQEVPLLSPLSAPPSAVTEPSSLGSSSDEADGADGETISLGAFLDTERTGSDGSDSGSKWLVVECAAGHRNPPGATQCRQCADDVPVQRPTEVPNVELGTFRFSTGVVVPVGTSMLVGRDPKQDDDAGGPLRLMSVPSPGRDISRTHVEVRVEGWSVLVTDRASANGTTITLPSGSTHQLEPGQPTTLAIGGTVSLAGEVDFTYEAPA